VAEAVELPNGDGAAGALAIDLNFDPYLDLVLLPGIYLGREGRQFMKTTGLGRYTSRWTAGDLNSDGLLDLVGETSFGGKLEVWLSPGDGTFLPPSHFDLGAGVSDIAIADQDGDGLADLLTANRFGNSVTILRQIAPALADS